MRSSVRDASQPAGQGQGVTVAGGGPAGYLRQAKPTGRTDMIVIAALIIGAALGWRRAVKLGGNRKDRVQYAVAFALVFAMIGVFATIFVHRMA